VFAAYLLACVLHIVHMKADMRSDSVPYLMAQCWTSVSHGYCFSYELIGWVVLCSGA
jgi:hypothetical protein